jgi:voltage-gated potassium channel
MHDRLSTAARRRRALIALLLRGGLVTTALLIAYFTLPMTGARDLPTGLTLAVGLLAVSGLVAWQVRAVVRSPYPRLRAIDALITTVPLFLLLFAATYYVVGSQAPDNFSEPLTRVDSLYFTVTVFSTVGFGDITATSQAARVLAIGQMLADLVLVGLIVRVLLRAVRVGRRRQRHPGNRAGRHQS